MNNISSFSNLHKKDMQTANKDTRYDCLKPYIKEMYQYSSIIKYLNENVGVFTSIIKILGGIKIIFPTQQSKISLYTNHEDKNDTYILIEIEFETYSPDFFDKIDMLNNIVCNNTPKSGWITFTTHLKQL